MPTSFLSHLVRTWLKLRYSYWFIPAVMMALSVVLAFAFIALDRTAGKGFIESLGWVYAGGSDGAREVLSVIASSMITVAGVVFSITIVALQLASTQFGPRVLRNFMRDRGNQIVLGTFVATFVYSLIVLRTIRGGEEELVPAMSVTFGVLLAILSLAVLIYYVHHSAMSIQASQIVRAIGHELYETIDRIYPDEIGEETDKHPDTDADRAMARRAREEGRPVRANRTGFVQATDSSLIRNIAKEHDLVVHLTARPGSFVTPASVALCVWPAENASDEIVERIGGTITIGSTRTHEQDLLFAANQLVEVAIRSLSPGINDPFTAMACIHWLSAALVRRQERATPSPYHKDREGRLRLIASVTSFEELVRTTCTLLRTYGADHPQVMDTLVEALERAMALGHDGDRKRVLKEQIDLLRRVKESDLSSGQSPDRPGTR